MPKRVKRSRSGGVELRIPEEERAFLATLGPELRDLYSADPGSDPALERLFPVAYPTDEDRETEYRLLVRDELRASLLGAIDTLTASVEAQRLDDDQANAWMRAINHVRLVLGARLEVTEEGDERPTGRDDPRLAAFAAYDYLSLLQAELIEALMG